MKKIFPDFQTFLDTRDGVTIGVTKITPTDDKCYFCLPKTNDVQILSEFGGVKPTINLLGDGSVYIFDASPGKQLTFTSRHTNDSAPYNS